MKPFQAPLDDIMFSLNHVVRAGSVDEYDAEFVGEIGSHFAAYAEGEIAPLDAAGDRQGCRLENGRVVMPDGYVALYKDFAEQGWQGLTTPEEFGGQGMGGLMQAVTSEIFSGANHSLQMVTSLAAGAVRTILRFGSAAQKDTYISSLASGETLATMCLTEPGAGSDLSKVRCRALPNGDGWKINGEKIFISGGDQDMSDRILHLVLARTSDNGVKGLSLFLCPSEKADDSRNDVVVTRIEEKMGLHASPTCQLAFDDAEAELIGEEGKGLAAMFTMMNHARADVALQGVAHAARSYDVASAYAAERQQGRNADGTSATLDQHGDVVRMLAEIDAYALGGRAIAHLSFVTMEAGDNPDLAEFLTPIAKSYCTDAGIKAAELGIQVLGGYGYLQEYRLEQTYRDARIASIYEGANGIHSRMLATRLLGSPAATAFEDFVKSEAMMLGREGIATCLGLWQSARDHLRASSDPTPMAHDFMALTVETLQQCLWGRMLSVASEHTDTARIEAVAGKAAARGLIFAPAYCTQVLQG